MLLKKLVIDTNISRRFEGHIAKAKVIYLCCVLIYLTMMAL